MDDLGLGAGPRPTVGQMLMREAYAKPGHDHPVFSLLKAPAERLSINGADNKHQLTHLRRKPSRLFIFTVLHRPQFNHSWCDEYFPLTRKRFENFKRWLLEIFNRYRDEPTVQLNEAMRDLYASDRDWSLALLRYFNPAGAHPSGEIGASVKLPLAKPFTSYFTATVRAGSSLPPPAWRAALPNPGSTSRWTGSTTRGSSTSCARASSPC